MLKQQERNLLLYMLLDCFCFKLFFLSIKKQTLAQ